MTRSGHEPTTYRVRGGHASHLTNPTRSRIDRWMRVKQKDCERINADHAVGTVAHGDGSVHIDSVIQYGVSPIGSSCRKTSTLTSTGGFCRQKICIMLGYILAIQHNNAPPTDQGIQDFRRSEEIVQPRLVAIFLGFEPN